MSADPSQAIAATCGITVVTGIAIQAVARTVRVPAIVLLLLGGAALGPSGLNVVQPEAFGDGLRVIIGFCVAIVLFEGGLSLKPDMIREAPRAIRNLVLLGSLVTWVLATATAYLVFPELGLGVSILFGSIVIVSGPTVILPLLRLVRPRARLASVLRGEAILNDPIGALAAALVLEFLVAQRAGESSSVWFAFALRIVVGVVIGGLTGYLLYQALKRELLLAPDLKNLVVLAGALGCYVLSEAIIGESGVLCVTVAGLLLAWLHPPGLDDIEEFKGQLVLLMVSLLFILLAASIPLGKMFALGPRLLLVVGSLAFVVRPAAVFASSIGTKLNLRERLFLSWMAPRGIVAASVSSLFALILAGHGIPGAEELQLLTFAVIGGTVILQGPTVRSLGRWLSVLEQDSNGCLIVGGNRVGHALGRALTAHSIPVILVDTNPARVRACQSRGLSATRRNILDEFDAAHLDLETCGRLIAVTPNDTVNRLAVRLFTEDFGAENVRAILHEDSPRQDGLRFLFGDLDWDEFSRRIVQGWAIETVMIDEKVKAGDLPERLGPESVPLLLISKAHQIVFMPDEERDIPIDHRLLYLSPPSA